MEVDQLPLHFLQQLHSKDICKINVTDIALFRSSLIHNMHYLGLQINITKKYLGTKFLFKDFANYLSQEINMHYLGLVISLIFRYFATISKFICKST